MAKAKKVKETKVRDEWIPMTWKYNGSGFQKNKKKELPRKQKYKKNGREEMER